MILSDRFVFFEKVSNITLILVVESYYADKERSNICLIGQFKYILVNVSYL